MDGRFERRMRDSEVVHDTRLLGDFVVIYCRGVHDHAKRHVLRSDGAATGAYGRKTPVVCDECAELLCYAEVRRAFCPKEPKPFCSHCDTHCYRPDMRERMRDVMKYSGPRSVVHGHALDSIKHAVEERRFRRATAPGTETGRRES